MIPLVLLADLPRGTLHVVKNAEDLERFWQPTLYYGSFKAANQFEDI